MNTRYMCTKGGTYITCMYAFCIMYAYLMVHMSCIICMHTVDCRYYLVARASNFLQTQDTVPSTFGS